jgi:phosphopantetheinyl transferase
MSKHVQTIRIQYWQINLELEDNETLESGECLQEIVERILKQHNGDDLQATNDISRDIYRYMKLQDRWIAFCSILLKSRLFHMTKMTKTSSNILPITRLPRNARGKPFLPPGNQQIKFNISHQYPFIGLSLYDVENYADMEIGLDIVTFDDYLKQRIPVDEFLRYYCNSFTPFEWIRICYGSETSRIRNFYIRWAIKESISKAKGIGLAMDFASFQVLIHNFDCIDSKTDEPASLEDLYRGSEHGCQTNTNVVSTLQQSGKPEEYWILSFNFIERDDHQELQGCSCISIGPFSQMPSATLYMTHQVMNMDDLIKTHLQFERNNSHD